MITVIVFSFFILFGKIKPTSSIFSPISPSANNDFEIGSGCSHLQSGMELEDLYDSSPIDIYRTNSVEYPGYGVWSSKQLNTSFLFPEDGEVIDLSPNVRSLSAVYYYEGKLSAFSIVPGRLKKPCETTLTSTMTDREIEDFVGVDTNDTYAKRYAKKLFDEFTKTEIVSVKLKNTNQNIRKKGLTYSARVFEVIDDRGVKYDYIAMITVKKGISVASIYFGNSGFTQEDLTNMIIFAD